MAAAAGAHPELVGCPRHARSGIAHFHLRAAALTPDVKVDFAHEGGFYMIPAIVLAAGKSTRMGRAKACYPLGDGHTFLTRIVRTLLDADVDDCVVVLGHDADGIMRDFAGSGLAARFVINRDYESGQLSSLNAGLRAVDRPGVAGSLVTLVDVPFVSVSTVRAVLAAYRSVGAPIIRPALGGRHGHPVFIARALFDELARADPAAGARSVVRAHASTAGDLQIEDEGAFADIDTVEDYERYIRIFGADENPPTQRERR